MRKVFLLLAVMASPALAQDFIYVSSEGHQYRYSLNQNGAVLQSLYPVARFTGTGAMTQVETGIETLYLGRNCDAYSQHLGTGSWSWANGGVVVDLPGARIGFPRQEIDANNGLNCQM